MNADGRLFISPVTFEENYWANQSSPTKGIIHLFEVKSAAQLVKQIEEPTV
jgi:hypothetical protein